jgi:uncharacterized protein YqeY
MGLVDRVNEDIATGMKARDHDRLIPLRMLKTAFVNRRVERGRDLDDTEAVQVVNSLIKQRRDSIEQFQRAGRQDLADKEAAEIRTLEAYLPPAIDPADVERVIDEVIAETGASSAKDFGRVMKGAMARFAGQQVDGKVVSELVRRKLAG